MSDAPTLDTSVVDWVIDCPDLAPVLEAFGIDYNCGGRSLRYACEREGLDPDTVMQQLEEARRPNRDG